MASLRPALAPALLLACAACSPTFDWREARPDSTLQVLFPCRPASLTRQVQLAGRPESMQISSCSTGGLTFGVSRVEAGDPVRVSAVMQSVRESTASNLSATDGAESFPLPPMAGVRSHPSSGRFRIAGLAPDGTALVAHAVLFTARGVVYQVTVIGARTEPEVVDMFFESIRLASG